jgi:predicted MPP superfamily phosphohydrolase
MLFASMVDGLRALTEWMPTWLLYVGACLGHAYLWTVALNLLYGNPIPRWILKFTRKIDVLFILSGPAIFWYALDLSNTSQLQWESSGPRLWLAPYTVFCWVLGLIVAPIAQVLYWSKRTAAHQTSCTSRIIDVARELGYPPSGRGKHAGFCGLPFNQVFQVEFTEKTLVLPQLPAAWDGLTILHVTDLHLCGTPDREFHQFVMNTCMKDGVPDLIALTGDVVDSSWHHRWILPVLGRLRWNLAAYAILGNHDEWRKANVIRRRLGRLGMRVLGNTWEMLEVRGQPMVVIGHEGPWFTPPPNLSDCPTGVFRLCLSHTPDNFSWARRHNIDLVLAGHVHGGQIRFPLIGATFVPSRYSRQYDCGTFFAAPTVMHVCRGVGGQHPVRILCRPEVTRLVLKKG